MASNLPDGTELLALGHDYLEVDSITMDVTRAKYVCGICYQHLTLHQLYGGEVIALMCSDIECSGHGFVTNYYARVAKTKARMDLHNAHLDLKNTPFEDQLDNSGHKLERLTEEQIKRSLGF